MAFMERSEYDRDVSTWSPEGRIFQLEYAVKAIEQGGTAIGLVCKDGVILAVEKKISSPLVVAESIEKVFEIDHHMGCAMSGITSDARTLVEFARNEASWHWFTYNENMSVESCVNSIADMALDFSDMRDGGKRKTMSRPFGVSLLIIGVDSDGSPQLFDADPTGTYTKHAACAIGAAHEGAKSLLQEQYNADMSMEEGTKMLLTILRQQMQDAMTELNVELARVSCATRQYEQLGTAELKTLIDALPDDVAAM